MQQKNGADFWFLGVSVLAISCLSQNYELGKSRGCSCHVGGCCGNAALFCGASESPSCACFNSDASDGGRVVYLDKSEWLKI